MASIVAAYMLCQHLSASNDQTTAFPTYEPTVEPTKNPSIYDSILPDSYSTTMVSYPYTKDMFITLEIQSSHIMTRTNNITLDIIDIITEELESQTSVGDNLILSDIFDYVVREKEHDLTQNITSYEITIIITINATDPITFAEAEIINITSIKNQIEYLNPSEHGIIVTNIDVSWKSPDIIPIQSNQELNLLSIVIGAAIAFCCCASFLCVCCCKFRRELEREKEEVSQVNSIKDYHHQKLELAMDVNTNTAPSYENKNDNANIIEPEPQLADTENSTEPEPAPSSFERERLMDKGPKSVLDVFEAARNDEIVHASSSVISLPSPDAVTMDGIFEQVFIRQKSIDFEQKSIDDEEILSLKQGSIEMDNNTQTAHDGEMIIHSSTSKISMPSPSKIGELEYKWSEGPKNMNLRSSTIFSFNSEGNFKV